MKCRKLLPMTVDPARLAAAGLLLLATCGQALELDRSQEILFEADTIERDEQAQLTVMTGSVSVRQGSLDIRADRAEFHGPLETLNRLVVEGAPATLHQALEQREGDLDARARRIEYDLVEGQLVLTGNAEVNQGNRHLSGERIRYDLGRDRVIAEGDTEPGGERVRIRIDPETPDSR